MNIKVKDYIGKSVEEILQTIEKEYEEYKVLKEETKRKKPFFWKKEVRMQVAIGNSKEEMKQMPKTEMKMKTETITKEEKHQTITDMLEGKRKTEGNRQNNYYEKERQQLERTKMELTNELKQIQKEKEHEKQYETMKTSESDYIFDTFVEKLIDVDVDKKLAKLIMEEIRTELSEEEFQDINMVKVMLKKKIERRIKVTNGFDLEKQKIISLVGPTGVGKTTTLAKIAGTLVQNGKTFGMITTDVYRIAAAEQLEKYAKILGSKFSIVSSPKQLKKEIDLLLEKEGVEYVLIDTVGRSAMKKESIEAIQEYLHVMEADHVSLVLSSTQKQKDIMKIAENYAPVKVDSAIFTKLDETLSCGAILNVTDLMNIPVSYITDGQEVPMDIKIANSKDIAQKIVNGVEEDGSSK